MYFVIDNDCVVSSIITIDFANKNDSIFAAICNHEEVSLLTILNLRALILIIIQYRTIRLKSRI